MRIYDLNLWGLSIPFRPTERCVTGGCGRKSKKCSTGCLPSMNPPETITGFVVLGQRTNL